MIRTFLFDMGNVLVHFSHEKMCEQIGSMCDLSAGDIRRLLFESGLQWEFERGLISRQQFHRRFQELVEQSLKLEELERAGSEIFQINRPMLKILDELKSLGHRLVLFSNTSISHFEYVQQNFDILEKFDDFVVSYRVGAMKPEKAIYEAALQKIDCSPSECFYTDDVAEYVDTGRRFGFQGEVFTTPEIFLRHIKRYRIELPH